MSLQFIDATMLESFDQRSFRGKSPYPWWNPSGLLTGDGFDRLCDNLPALDDLEPQFGVHRRHGQTSHDRYALRCTKRTPLPDAWALFLAELQGPAYRRFLHRAFGPRPLLVSFHFHFAPRGASVSPHCDASRKLGSHIFYMNRESDWREEWGGQTLVLDDEGALPRESAPSFEDFARIIETKALGNYSLLFARRKKSWHGVRPLACPEGHLRKVFIVMIEEPLRGFADRVYDAMRGRPQGQSRAARM